MSIKAVAKLWSDRVQSDMISQLKELGGKPQNIKGNMDELWKICMEEDVKEGAVILVDGVVHADLYLDYEGEYYCITSQGFIYSSGDVKDYPEEIHPYCEPAWRLSQRGWTVNYKGAVQTKPSFNGNEAYTLVSPKGDERVFTPPIPYKGWAKLAMNMVEKEGWKLYKVGREAISYLPAGAVSHDYIITKGMRTVTGQEIEDKLISARKTLKDAGET